MTTTLLIAAVISGTIIAIILRDHKHTAIIETSRLRSIAKHQARWNAMSPNQQRSALLANFWVPANFLPHAFIGDDGGLDVPNDYHGGRPACISLEKLLSPEEIQNVRNFIELRDYRVTTA